MPASLATLFIMFNRIAADDRSAGARFPPLGEFDGNIDIGSPKPAGAVVYDSANQVYTITGGGSNLCSPNDECHFVWKKIQGDFIVRSRWQFAGPCAIARWKAGWLVRSNLHPGAPYMDAAERENGGISLQFRRAAGGGTGEISLAITHADVLQLERQGNSYTFSAARFGEPFVSAQLPNLDLGDEVLAGLFVCSADPDIIATARFQDVRIIRPVKSGFVPYQDYIGSVLEILNVHSGKLEKIYSSAQPFEAPNWTTDGQALIYNISGRGPGWGRLNRFELATGTRAQLDTTPANRNNNDHVLSFDGTMLGLSDQSEDHGGQSRIFTMPIQGGTPRRITPLTPSYLHGWSPDGKYLVYTGGRSNKFDIYQIPSDGSGPEVRLTNSTGLNDGPEYTSDGRYIYFNSSRTGKMQIWRMKPDGRDQEQVTGDEFNNWFPHVSPDGKWIVIISYPAGIRPEEHPYYQHCYLRLLPFDGGTPKVIAYIYGGQGTINVPSWSPDSRRIAFVSNTDLSQQASGLGFL